MNKLEELKAAAAYAAYAAWDKYYAALVVRDKAWATYNEELGKGSNVRPMEPDEIINMLNRISKSVL